MKMFVSILIFFIGFKTSGQHIQLIAPHRSIIAGTAFQVQYVITDATAVGLVTLPSLDSFQVISGPHYYRGNNLRNGASQVIENITYTLIAAHKGTFLLKGIKAQFKTGREEKQPDTVLLVLAPQNASYNAQSNYTDASFYNAPKDLEKLISENLFMKVDVNKTQCFTGEPIVATFTLYSSLESTSEAIKAPGIYGFNMVDMLDINKPHQSVASVNGKIFNTYIFRMMQLYPVQSGDLTIDPMHVDNEIEFEDSTMSGHKKLMKKELVTPSIIIHVKPLPLKRPEGFTGAVGQFKISVSAEMKTFSINQENKLMIVINGKGNFMQFTPPEVILPDGLHISEPEVRDTFNKLSVPENGERTYIYNITAARSGKFNIPPLAFSYFDVASSSFKTVISDSLSFVVQRENNTIKKIDNSTTERKSTVLISSLIFFILAVTCTVIYFKRKYKKPKTPAHVNIAHDPSVYEQINSIDTDSMSSKEAIQKLQIILSGYLKERSQYLLPEVQQNIQQVINDCALFLYSYQQSFTADELIKRGRSLLIDIKN